MDGTDKNVDGRMGGEIVESGRREGGDEQRKGNLEERGGREGEG